MKLVLLALLFSASFAQAEQKCAISKEHVHFLAGAWIAHQATTNKHFLQGEKPSGVFNDDVLPYINAPKITELPNCMFMVQSSWGTCDWEVIVNANSGLIDESSSHYCETRD